MITLPTQKNKTLAEIHPTALVNPGAELGNDVRISPFSIIEDKVIIGNNTWIGSNVLIVKGTRIGDNCEIHHGAILGAAPQDIKYHSEETTLEIGDNTIIREYCTLNRGSIDRFKTVIGSNCFLMTYVHVAHDCILSDHVIIANSVNMAGHVEIQDYVGIGGLVPIHQFVRIGKHAFIGGGFRIPKDIPPFLLAAGEPLEYAGTNSVGLRRRNFSKEAINRISKAYKILFRSKLNVSQAVSRIKEEFEVIDEIKEIIDFIESSERGILK